MWDWSLRSEAQTFCGWRQQERNKYFFHPIAQCLLIISRVTTFQPQRVQNNGHAFCKWSANQGYSKENFVGGLPSLLSYEALEYCYILCIKL
jgi:hypothetical protein